MKLEFIVSIVVAVFASTGFWAFVMSFLQRKDAKTKMILGLGHDRIKTLCEKYIAQGWLTSDDYEDLDKYLFQPYQKMGGNGTAEKLMNDVKKLPIKTKPATKA